MTDDNLTTVAVYPDEGIAAIARSALSAADIPVYALDGATTTTLWHVGTALGGVRLQVPSSYAEEAKRVLQDSQLDLDEVVPPQQAWKCPRCDAEVDAGFGVCWSCGTPATESAVSESLATQSGSLVSGSISKPTGELNDLDEIDGNRMSEGQESADALADRAWRTALIACVFPPLWIYGVYLIVSLGQCDLGPAAMRKFYKSLAILMLIFFGGCGLTISKTLVG